EQARIAEDAGAVAVMALERVPADIRLEGGVARMADPDKIVEIQEAVTIPVMAKARIGHFVEAQILEALEVDYIDESEVLTPADTAHHIDKWKFTVPFVCGCTNLGEALRRIAEGAAMIRTKGEAGTGDIVNAVTHMRAVFGAMRRLQSLREDELHAEAKELRAPYELVRWVAEHGRLPVVTFTAGGIATPADASLCMQLGADGRCGMTPCGVPSIVGHARRGRTVCAGGDRWQAGEGGEAARRSPRHRTRSVGGTCPGTWLGRRSQGAWRPARVDAAHVRLPLVLRQLPARRRAARTRGRSERVLHERARADVGAVRRGRRRPRSGAHSRTARGR